MVFSFSTFKNQIKIEYLVKIIQKQNQSKGKLREELVKRKIIASDFHIHGIKIELNDGKIRRVQKLC